MKQNFTSFSLLLVACATFYITGVAMCLTRFAEKQQAHYTEMNIKMEKLMNAFDALESKLETIPERFPARVDNVDVDVNEDTEKITKSMCFVNEGYIGFNSSLGTMCDLFLIFGLLFGMVYVFGSHFLQKRLIQAYIYECMHRRDFGDFTLIAVFLGLAVVLDHMGWLLGQETTITIVAATMRWRKRKNKESNSSFSEHKHVRHCD